MPQKLIESLLTRKENLHLRHATILKVLLISHAFTLSSSFAQTLPSIHLPYLALAPYSFPKQVAWYRPRSPRLHLDLSIILSLANTLVEA